MLTGLLDRSALYGVLAEIEGLGLDVLEVCQLTRTANHQDQVTPAHRAVNDIAAAEGVTSTVTHLGALLRHQPQRRRARLHGRPGTALSYPWKHLIAGHLGRLGTRDDVTLHQQYIADIEADARTALATVDPTPYFQKYGENLWAAVRGYLDAVAEAAAAPVIQKYTGVLGAVDVFTVPTAFSILESIRLDLGYHMDVHP